MTSSTQHDIINILRGPGHNRDLQTSVHGLRSAPVCERLSAPALNKEKKLDVSFVILKTRIQPLPVAVCDLHQQVAPSDPPVLLCNLHALVSVSDRRACLH